MMSKTRADVVQRAMVAGLTGEADDWRSLFTDDVVGWSPTIAVSSLEELEEAFGERQDVFSNVVLEINSIDEIGNKVIAEWQLSADHTGPFVVDDDLVIPETQNNLVMAGVTVSEFRGDRIANFRSYFDDLALLEQMLAPAL